MRKYKFALQIRELIKISIAILGVKIFMSLNKIKKTIYFFKTIPDYSLFSKTSNDSTVLYEMFNKRFVSIGPYFTKDLQRGIEIFSFDEHHIYGIFLKKDESTNQFVRLTLKENDTSKEINLNKQNIIFEHYSFFFVDLDKCITSIISNKQSGKFTDIINQLLFEENYHIQFIPYSIDSIDNAINRFSKIKYIDTLYSPSVSKEAFENLHQYHDEDALEIEKLKIRIKVSKTGPKFIENLEKVHNERKKYEKYKIEGETEDGVEQIFDILDKTFFSSTHIEIQGRPEDYIYFIKYSFQSEINRLYAQENS